MPRPGLYSLRLWLRDEAGNDAPSSALEVPLRFDDVAPAVAFAPSEGADFPTRIRATVIDAHAGPAGGRISYRRLGTEAWSELPIALEPDGAGRVALVARTPDLAPGHLRLPGRRLRCRRQHRRDDAARRRHRDGDPQDAAAGAGGGQDGGAGQARARAKTRLFARLRGGHGRGDALTVPFGAPALLSGRLTRADGPGIAGRELRVVARPSRGALAPGASAAVVTGARGGFELRLAPGPSRRISVSYPGDAGLGESSRRSLELRVRSGISLSASPLSLRTGQMLRLGGRVRGRGAAIPRRGKLVAIQYLEAATGRWRPVLVTRTDHDGRFRARYRFRYVDGSASIRLRATALVEERWPYAPGSSRPVTVRVSGR